MGVPVKATCSECLTIQFTKLEFNQENVKCPVCGHSMKNLPEGELNEMETALKQQRIFQIVAIAAFALGGVAFCLWASARDPAQEVMSSGAWAVVAAVGFVGSIVCGVLGSRVRYIIEF
jgi:Zn ribbon nucleic-acid-binding protein